MPTGLVDSFLQAYTQTTELQRQKKLDEQAAVQQAVDTSLRKHQQEIEEQRNRVEAEHYKALERQAMEMEAHRLNQEALAARKQAFNERLGEGRLLLGQTLARQKAGTSWENIQSGLLRWMSTQAFNPEEQQQMLSQLRADYEFSTGSVLGGDHGVAPPVTPLGPSPMAAQTLKDKADENARRQRLSDDLHDVHEAATKKAVADTAYTQARTELVELQKDYVPKNYQLKVEEFNWRKVFQGQELNLREFSNMTARIEAQLRANAQDVTAIHSMEGVRSWARAYNQKAASVLTTANMRLNQANAAKASAESVVKQINAMPETEKAAHAKELVDAQGKLAAMTPTYFKTLQDAVTQATNEKNRANDALYEANRVTAKAVTPRGTVVPGVPRLGPAAFQAAPPGKSLPSGVRSTKFRPKKKTEADPLGIR